MHKTGVQPALGEGPLTVLMALVLAERPEVTARFMAEASLD